MPLVSNTIHRTTQWNPMARPVLSIRNRVSRRRLTKMDPGKNVRAVLLAMRTSGKYGRSAARNAIRAS